MAETDISYHQQFADDIQEGFSQQPKIISSKYFYDDRGSQLFAEIMNLDEYYLTDCEYEIFNLQREQITQAFLAGGDGINLIELGAGNGLKTQLLLSALYEQQADFEYSPIDISEEAMQSLVSNLKARYPNMKVNPLIMDYFHALDVLEEQSDKRKIVMFLGANIGNYTHKESIDLIQQIKSRLQKADMLFIGYDLKKDPRAILNAYDDAKGVTKAFNLNLLERMNRELGANFELAAFDHYAIYEPISGEARSYLISLKNQDVYFDALEKTISFNEWELIHTEISRKFDLQQIEAMAQETGFRVVEHFRDKRKFFNDSLWQFV
ncbi:MAG: L-histidine N(alpha)-methyltransferase [Flammeovirgaceae bacterium]